MWLGYQNNLRCCRFHCIGLQACFRILAALRKFQEALEFYLKKKRRLESASEHLSTLFIP